MLADISRDSAGIGFGPNGMQALDMLEPGFRALYEGLCVGNKSDDAQWVFFEGNLIAPGFGDDQPWNGNLKSAWGHKDYLRKSVSKPPRSTPPGRCDSVTC